MLSGVCGEIGLCMVKLCGDLNNLWFTTNYFRSIKLTSENIGRSSAPFLWQQIALIFLGPGISIWVPAPSFLTASEKSIGKYTNSFCYRVLCCWGGLVFLFSKCLEFSHFCFGYLVLRCAVYMGVVLMMWYVTQVVPIPLGFLTSSLAVISCHDTWLKLDLFN